MKMKDVVNLTLVLALVTGAGIFGWLGKTGEMGVFVLASALALVFNNLSQFESFKGAGFEAKVGKGIDSESFEQYSSIFLEQTKKEISSALKQLPLSVDKNQIAQAVEKSLSASLDQIEEKVSEQSYVTVDVSRFRNDRSQWKYKVQDYDTVNDFLDDVFMALPGVLVFSYNLTWILRNAKTGHMYREIDRKGLISLEEAGIMPGMKLEVIKLP
jgi:hypothetical protein